MTCRNPDQRQEQQVEKPERIATKSRKHRCESRNNTHPLRSKLDELRYGNAMIPWAPLFNSRVEQKQGREEHNDSDGIADPKMKSGLGKTAPRDNPGSGIGGDKTARDDPRTDDRHDQQQDDL